MCFAGFQPGSGKSTLSDVVFEYLTDNGLKVLIIRADSFRNDLNGKKAFEEQVIENLFSKKYKIIIYDKNIPNMRGYEVLENLIKKTIKKSRGGAIINCVPIVPGSFTEDDADLCIQRVMNREEGTQALTGGSTFADYESVEEFTKSIFSYSCISFVPLAQTLKNAIVLTDYSYSNPIPGQEQLKTFL